MSMTLRKQRRTEALFLEHFGHTQSHFGHSKRLSRRENAVSHNECSLPIISRAFALHATLVTSCPSLPILIPRGMLILSKRLEKIWSSFLSVAGLSLEGLYSLHRFFLLLLLPLTSPSQINMF